MLRNFLAPAPESLIYVGVPSTYGVSSSIDDNTNALQAAINDAIPGGKHIRLPLGILNISRPLVIPFGVGWIIEGEARGGNGNGTIINQLMDNEPIFIFSASLTWGWSIKGITFRWEKSQPATSNTAVALYFAPPDGGTIFNFRVDSCNFYNGFRALAIRALSNGVSIWGAEIRNCVHQGSMTGAFIAARCEIAVGQPCLNLDRIYIDCAHAMEASIQVVAQDNMTMKDVEFNNGNYQVGSFSQIDVSSGNIITLIGCKTEAAHVDGAVNLWKFSNTQVVVLGCSCNGLIVKQGGATFLHQEAPGAMSIIGLTCNVKPNGASEGYAFPYGGSSIEIVSNVVLSTGFQKNLRKYQGDVGMPALDTSILTQDFTNFVGDASIELTKTSGRVQYFHAHLTADRTCKLPRLSFDGMEFTIVKLANDPYSLTIEDPLSGKRYVIPARCSGFSQWRAVNDGEWIVLNSGLYDRRVVPRESTVSGLGEAKLGSNCPAMNSTSPATWEMISLPDGSIGYVPIWK